MEISHGNVFKTVKIGNSTIKRCIDREFHIKLSTDKQTIQADGLEQATITAKVYNYLNEFQSNKVVPVTFTCDGVEQVKETVNGETAITFSTTVTGTHKIHATSEKMRGAEIEVLAE